MLKITLLLLSIFAFSSAFNPTLTKNFFFVTHNNKFSTRLFQTNNGIIAYNMENLKTGPGPQYVNIDIKNRNVKPILNELISACGQGAPAHDPLHYHTNTSKLVYYCMKNHSLLLLNENDYSVQASFKTNLTVTSYTEAKITTEGDVIAILLMSPFFTTSPIISHIVKFDLNSRQFTLSRKFDYAFGIGEQVVGYASNLKASYLVTNRIEGPNLVTSFYWISFNGDKYDTYPVASVNAPLKPVRVITQLFLVGDRIVFNSAYEVYFFDSAGNAVSIQRVEFKPISSSSDLSHIVMISQPGSNDIYILFQDDRIRKYTVAGDQFHYKDIGNAGDMQIAFGNKNNNDIMFSLCKMALTFTITDLKTLEVLYATIAGFDTLMLTDKTYATVESSAQLTDYNVYIFDRKTDVAKFKIPISPLYHHNKEQGILSYFTLKGPQFDDCDLVHIDLATGRTWKSWNFSGLQICGSTIVDLIFKDSDYPHVTIPKLGGNTYIITTPSTGQVVLTPPKDMTIFDEDTVFVNYSNMSLYYFNGYSKNQTTRAFYYEYNSNTKSFEQKSSFNITGVPFNKYYSTSSGNKAILFAKSSFSVLDLNKVSTEKFDFNAGWNTLNTFQDELKDDYVLFSTRLVFFARNDAPGLYGPKGLGSLPNAGNYTMRSGVANKCTYWVEDEFACAISFVKLYDACGKNGSTQEITI